MTCALSRKWFAFATVILLIVPMNSINAQALWSKLAQLPAGKWFETMTVHPNGDMFATVWDDGKIWRSTDHGATWTQVVGSLSMWGRFTFDYRGYIYSLNWNRGLYRSTDNGDTWTNLVSRSTLPESIRTLTLRGLGISRNGSLFIGFGKGVYSTGLLRSTDDGSTWIQAMESLPLDSANRALETVEFHLDGNIIAVLQPQASQHLYIFNKRR